MLKVGGFTPLSTTDWPGQLAAVVFVQGCPWRCHYCHNIELQKRDGALLDGWANTLNTLKRRQGLLDGVVFSGGEPTLDPALQDAIQSVRALGFKIGLHTAGIYPDKLTQVLPLVDWVGFDIKADFADYDGVTAVPRSGLPAWRSFQSVLRAVKHQALGLEVRTTYHPRLHGDDQLVGLATSLVHAGVARWVLQNFRPAYAEHADLAASWSPPQASLLQRLNDTGIELVLR